MIFGVFFHLLCPFIYLFIFVFWGGGQRRNKVQTVNPSLENRDVNSISHEISLPQIAAVCFQPQDTYQGNKRK